MKKNSYKKIAISTVIIAGFAGPAMAELTVDKSQGQLSVVSDFEGTVIAKIIGPNDEVLVNDRYEGNSFYWSPSSGADGAYRYDVRVVASTTEGKDDTRNNYAGGSVEVINGEMPIVSEELK